MKAGHFVLLIDDARLMTAGQVRLYRMLISSNKENRR